MAGGTHDEKAASEAWPGVSDRSLARLGRGLGKGAHETRTFLKLALTYAPARSRSASTRAKLHP